MIYDKSFSEYYENGRRLTLVSLALPLLCESLFLQLYGTCNTLLLGRYSEQAVTAASVSEMLVNIAIVVLTMVIKGAVILTSFALGKADRPRAQEIAGTASVAVTAAAVLLGAFLGAFAAPLIGMMNLSGQTAVQAAGYLQIRAAGLIFTALMSYFNNMLIVSGYTKCTLLVGLASNLLNVGLCYLFLYTNLRLPVVGTQAVVVAAALSQLFGALMAFPFFVKRCPYRFCFRGRLLGCILVLGIPSGMCTFSYTLSQAITTGFIATLGNAVVNAKVYISNIVTYTSRISIALGNATGILMGRYRGQGRFESIERLFVQNARLAVMCNLTLSLTVLACCRPLLSLFTEQAEILALAAPILLIDVLIEGARAVNHVGEFSLNANGDVKATFIISVLSTWVFGVLLSYLLGLACGLGLVGIWLAFLADEAARTVAYLLRWRSKQWKKTQL